MKRLMCAIVMMLLLFCGCEAGVDTDVAPTNSDRPASHSFKPVDLSLENVLQLTDFKCYVSHNNETFTIEGEGAKSLYKIIISSEKEQISHTLSKSDSVYLLFYNSSEYYSAGNDNFDVTDFYGAYSVFDNGVMNFSGSPFMSAIYSYKTDATLFQTVIKCITE